MSDGQIYRVIFSQGEHILEMYASSVSESDMFGFIEIGEFLFTESSPILIDTAQEQLKQQFSNVKRTYIPAHSVLRIDEVTKRGASKIYDKQFTGSNISPLPIRPNITK